MINLFNFFFKNEAVIGIQSPLDYIHVKIIRYSLGLLNSWPLIERGEIKSKFFSLILSSILTILIFTHAIGSILYIKFHGKYLSFMDLGYAYITTFMNAVIIIHKRVHNISHSYTMCLAIQTFAGVIFFCVMPLHYCYSSNCYNQHASRNLNFNISVYIIYPFNTYSSMGQYVFISIYNSIFAYLASIWFCIFDLFLSIMVFHVYGHFKILLHKLNTFPKPYQPSNKILQSYERYSDIELQIISKLLRSCIDYHKLIVSFTKQMSDAFGTMLLVYYTFHQVSGCLLLLECSQMTAEALIRCMPMTIILYQQLIQLSIVFELIGSTSEELKVAVYGLPWESFDVRNRKTVLLLLMNVQEPIHVKALGIANVGVTAMAAILKTSLSYFTFLRSK